MSSSHADRSRVLFWRVAAASSRGSRRRRSRRCALTLDDAHRAGACETSHRLGRSAGARGRRARPRSQVRAGGDAADGHCHRPATRAPITSTSSAFRTPDGARLRHLSRHPGQLPSRARSCSGRSTPAGRLDALERAAAAEARRGRRRTSTTARADLRLEVARAYWALVTAREAVRVLEESLARADAQVRDVAQPARRGLMPPNDVLDARGAAVAASGLQLIEATNQRGVARRRSAPPDRARPDDVDRAGRRRSTAVRRHGAGSADAAGWSTRRVEAAARTAGAQPFASTARERAAWRRPTPAASRRSARRRLRLRATRTRASSRARHAGRTSWDVGVNVSWTFCDGGRTARGGGRGRGRAPRAASARRGVRHA